MMYLLIFLFTVTTATFTDLLFSSAGTAEGSGTVSKDIATIVDTKGRCALLCLSNAPCSVYAIMVREEGGYYCMNTTCRDVLPAGNWTIYTEQDVMLHRFDGSVNFNVSWADYKVGFGDSAGEQWMGLNKIHAATFGSCYGLNVTIEAWDGNRFWAYYSSFSVGPESDNYRLNVSGYDVSSTAPDSLGWHDDMEFSTIDNDNDQYGTSYHCSAENSAGWWYNACYECKPTGLYVPGGVIDWQGLIWFGVPGYDDYYAFKSMKFTLIKNSCC